MLIKIYKVSFTAVAVCLCLLLICLVPGVSGAAAGSDIVFGDINGDGRIDVGDAILLLRYIVGLNDLELDQIGRANVNASFDTAGSPTLDVGDAILVLRRIVGLTEEFPAESANFFTYFSLGLPGETVEIDSEGQTVMLMVPYSAGSLEGKTALFGLPYGASACAVGIPPPTSPDFRDPVRYKITAPNGATADWTVTVSRYGEASGSWWLERTPLGILSEFWVSVSGLECATHYEVYAENKEEEMVLLPGPGDDDDDDKYRFALEETLECSALLFNYPAKLEVRFYDGADSITPVAAARCTGSENATAGDLIFNP